MRYIPLANLKNTTGIVNLCKEANEIVVVNIGAISVKPDMIRLLLTLEDMYDTSNNSDETCMPCDEVDVRAFQHGIALSIVVYTGQKTEGAIQCDTAVQAGTTTEVV